MLEFEKYLNQKIDKLKPSVTRDAMRYSLMAGGKRLRPEMVFSVLKGYGKDEHIGYDYAAGLEMLHTYSLIHDDLPAMDNDDLRRGRPTCHKEFDEATAILAGDGLLTYAFEVLASSNVEHSDKAVKVLAKMAGPDGMVLGQTLDMHEDEQVDYSKLEDIYRYKTGCLFSAALMLGSISSGYYDDETLSKWETIGQKIGIAFQIQDDLLDVRMSSEELGKSNSDIRNNKVTAVTLLGENEAEKLMNSLYEECDKMTSSIDDFDNSILNSLLDGVKTRLK